MPLCLFPLLHQVLTKPLALMPLCLFPLLHQVLTKPLVTMLNRILAKYVSDKRLHNRVSQWSSGQCCEPVAAGRRRHIDEDMMVVARQVCGGH